MSTVGDFEWTYTQEPHASRREMIKQAHPEVTKLFGPHPASKYMAAAIVALQVFVGWYVSRPTTPWWQFWVLAYVVGGTCSHNLTLAIHELSHHLFFKKAQHNVYYGFFCNFPLIIPYSNSFKKYHLEHHRYQGVDGTDVDIPTVQEAEFFTTPVRKFLWVLFQAFFYAIRPLIINPKPFNSMDFLNISTQVLFCGAVYNTMGFFPIFYMLMSTFLGLGMHPCAGHFISEHYTNLSSQAEGAHKTTQSPFIKKGDKLYPDETFSYRGPLNWVSYMVGYHVAHHDFPFISGWRLHEVEKLAPEFYEHLPSTRSWPGTIYDYIMSDSTPYDRVKRKDVTGNQGVKEGTKKDK